MTLLPNKNQNGIALIMTLFGLALVVLITAGIMKKQSTTVLRTQAYLQKQQQQEIALAAEILAKRMLEKDHEKDTKDGARIDALTEAWLGQSVSLPVENTNMSVSLQINDLSGRLNLNDLVTPSGTIDSFAQQRFTNLFSSLGIENLHIETLVDWIDSNKEETRPYGAEDGAYLISQPPYRSANQPFSSVTELRLMEGATEEEVQALMPYVTALPIKGNGLNINSAPVTVIMSLHPRIDRKEAQTADNRRKEKPFSKITEFLALPAFAGIAIPSERLHVSSHFFEAIIQVARNDGSAIRMVTRLYRDDQGKVFVIDRSLGRNVKINKPSAIL